MKVSVAVVGVGVGAGREIFVYPKCSEEKPRSAAHGSSEKRKKKKRPELATSQPRGAAETRVPRAAFIVNAPVMCIRRYVSQQRPPSDP